MFALYLLGAILLFGIVALAFTGMVHHDLRSDGILTFATPYSGRRLAALSFLAGILVCAAFPLLFAITPEQAVETLKQQQSRLAHEFPGQTVEIRAYSIHTFSSEELNDFLRDVPYWPMGLASIRAMVQGEPVTVLAPVRQLSETIEKLGDGPFTVQSCSNPPCQEYLAAGTLEQLRTLMADPAPYLKLRRALLVWLGIFFSLLVVYPTLAIFVLSRADHEVRARSLLRQLLETRELRGRRATIERASAWVRLSTFGVVNHFARTEEGDRRWISYRPPAGASAQGVLVALRDPSRGSIESGAYAFIPDSWAKREERPELGAETERKSAA